MEFVLVMLFRDWTPCDPIGHCAVSGHHKNLLLLSNLRLFVEWKLSILLPPTLLCKTGFFLSLFLYSNFRYLGIEGQQKMDRRETFVPNFQRVTDNKKSGRFVTGMRDG
jgi:hypothetical protein